MEVLLTIGADHLIPDKVGAQPLFRAAGITYADAIKLLLKART